MLTLQILNDTTGDNDTANYTYRVMVNTREVASGRVKGHRRADDWWKLVRLVIEDGEAASAEDDEPAQLDKAGGLVEAGDCGGNEMMREINTEQIPPTPNDLPAVWDLVIADMKNRDEMGSRKYNTRLQPFNGRDALVDAYEEALDLAVYLRQLIYEQFGR